MIPADRPVTGYRALADALRDEITAGRYAPGARFPSERDLQQRFGLARDTVRAAVAILRDEGLVVVRHGHATRVATEREKTPVRVEPGSTVEARPARGDERQRLGLRDGAWVLHVVGPDGCGDLYPADRFRLIVG